MQVENYDMPITGTEETVVGDGCRLEGEATLLLLLLLVGEDIDDVDDDSDDNELLTHDDS